VKGDAMSKPLIRSVPFQVTRDAGAGGDGLTLEGHAAVFNSPTRIDSWEGTFDEQIAPGAFKKSIREKTPVLQFDHGRHASIGSIPIGAIESLAEDDQGLYVRARMHDNMLIQPVRDAIASGAIDGMSFRFQVVKDEWRDAKGNLLTDPAEIEQCIYRPTEERGVLTRTLKEVKVPELGPVVFPAYQDTSVAVRDIALTLNDPEARAELVRLLGGTPTDAGEREGRSAPTGAADDTTEPGDHSEGTNTPRVRDNGLKLSRRTPVC
jgi:HK97 family phage prohead protease